MIQSIRNSHSLLVGMQSGTDTLEDSLAVSYKTKHALTIIHAPWYLPKGLIVYIYRKTCTWMFIAALFSFFFFSSTEDILSLHFREGGRGEERERERERNIDWLPPIHIPTSHRTYNLGTCPDPESNPQAFSYRTTPQPTEARRPGRYSSFILNCQILEVIMMSLKK